MKRGQRYLLIPSQRAPISMSQKAPPLKDVHHTLLFVTIAISAQPRHLYSHDADRGDLSHVPLGLSASKLHTLSGLHNVGHLVAQAVEVGLLCIRPQPCRHHLLVLLVNKLAGRLDIHVHVLFSKRPCSLLVSCSEVTCRCSRACLWVFLLITIVAVTGS